MVVYTDVQTDIRLSIYEEATKKCYTVAIGDTLTNLKFYSSVGSQSIPKCTITSFDIYTNPEGTRGSETRVDGISYSNNLRDSSQTTSSFKEVFTVRGIIVDDGTELHTIDINNIISIEKIEKSTITVFPGEGTPIADAIGKVSDTITGIYLSTGIYDEEITINKPLKIFGGGNGSTIITNKIKVNLTNSNQVVEINDVSVKAAMTANEGIVTLSDKGTLIMNGVSIYGTGANSADKSSLISKSKADAAGSNATIIMNNCSLTVGDGDHTKDAVAIRIGNATEVDKGATNLYVNHSTITTKNDTIQFFSRKKSEIVFNSCNIEGMTVLHMARNGENDNMGHFDVQFVDGSHVLFNNCNMKSINPYAANPSADSETNQSGLIELDHSKIVCVKVINSYMTVEHGISSKSVSGKFAPAYAVYIGKDSACQDCAVYLENVNISMIEATDSVACKSLVEGNRIQHLGVNLYARRDDYMSQNVSIV